MDWSSINLILSVINAWIAYDSFQRGQNLMGWVSVAVSAVGFVAGVL